jgi:transcriptional regulator with XRE-family HTH domain
MITMVKLSELRTEAEIHERDMHDVDYSPEVERTQFANDVAIKVIHYRVSRGMSQAELARMIGMRQPNIARLESGGHEPSLSTLARLSSVLGVDFSVEVKRGHLRLRNPVHGNAAPAPRRPAHGSRHRRAARPQKDQQTVS